ncbi:MAG: 50S ribosomal protein L22 [Bacteroidetes bacterium]|nr:MAG: 50S ribosomal protein L22 [Bacteroidota bacterium]
MASRKKERADKIKEERKNISYAKLNDCPTSPRKMRLVADLVRGKNVMDALNILKFTNKEAAQRLEKLVVSAISNWNEKNQGKSIEDEDVVISQIYVDSARMLKRLRPAPQGRAHRIRKRSNHVTVILDSVK